MVYFPYSSANILIPDVMGQEHMLSMGQGTGTWGNRASAAYPSANRALFFPFRIPKPMSFSTITLFNGATASGNIDAGLYAADGTRIASKGSTVATGTNTNQDFTFTSVILGRGLYYAAVAVDNATHTFITATALGLQPQRAMGSFQAATSFPLPATVTFASVTSAYVPVMFWQCQSSKQYDSQGDGHVIPMMNTVCPYSLESIGPEIMTRGGAELNSVASTAWPGNNWAIWVPFIVTEPIRIQNMWWWNGASVSGNVDAGIYFANGNSQTITKMVTTGTIAQSGTSVIQNSATIDITLGPGLFYMALASSTTAATFMRASVATNAGDGFTGGSYLWHDTSFNLPASLASANQFPSYLPVFGFTQGTVI